MATSSPVSPRLAAVLNRPTLDTQFHIDYHWWERQEREARVYLQSHLCSDHQAQFAELDEIEIVDSVHPDTAEVQRMDLVQHTLRTHCARQEDYLTHHTSLVDAVFRVFLANGNCPLTPVELAEAINRPGQEKTILRTLSGRRVYKGLRPLTA
ncbi:MAG: hypothetical protein ACE5FI_09155 [Anaerolineales bacterium]